MPPQDRFDEMFKPIPGSNLLEFVSAQDDWETHEFMTGGFFEVVRVEFVFVDPTTGRVEEDDNRNTALWVSLEGGGWVDQSIGDYAPEGGWDEHNKWVGCHDPDLDSVGPSAEEAILVLAQRVEFFYGDGAEKLSTAPLRCKGYWKDPENEKGYTSICVPGTDGYCTGCGYLPDGRVPLASLLSLRMQTLRQCPQE